MKNGNTNIVEAIVILLRGYCSCVGDSKRRSDYKYLICQCIRQYELPSDHYHMSVKAQELWDSLTSADIKTKFYRDKVKCDKITNLVTVTTFKGANHKGNEETLDNKSQFRFNSLFQCDHVIPVKFFFNRLLDLPVNALSSDKVCDILDEMHMCKITKEEDHRIGRTKDRYETFEETIARGAYKDINLVY